MAEPDPTFPTLRPWTNDEQRQHERFLDLAWAAMAEASTQFDLTTDEAEKADIMKWMVRIESERKLITVHDHAAIEQAMADYDRQLAMWRTARGR